MSVTKEKPSKVALGKGLASLLPPSINSPANVVVDNANLKSAPTPVTAAAAIPPQGAEADPISNKDRHPGIAMSAIDDLVANEYQPRSHFDEVAIEELSQSIKENGLIQPILVRKASKGYQIIAGERRWRAAKLAGLKQVPIVIRRSTDKEALELALIENIQREDLNCIETAQAYQQLATQFDLAQDEVAKKVGKDRASVANYLRLLRLPEKVQKWLTDGTLSFGHGRALLSLESADMQIEFATRSVDENWSVRNLEATIAKFKNPANQGEDKNEKKLLEEMDALALRLKNLGVELSNRYSTKVQIKGGQDRGKIILDYFTREDLNRIVDKLSSI